MKIIIIGAGKVGYNLALNLSKENHDVIIIDNDQEVINKADENLDAFSIKGNGVSTHVLQDAGVSNSDLLIAVTNSDEINMVCCLTGKKLGAKKTIARIRDPEYAQELTMLKEEIGLDMVINPEQAAAEEISKDLTYPAAVNVEGFAKGRVRMVEIKVTEDMPVANIKLKDLSSKIPHKILIGAAVRDGEVIVPGGEFEVRPDDYIYVLGNTFSISDFLGAKVKIIEIDMNKCTEIAESLPSVLIINGDGTDEEFLLSENIGEMDVFIALTGMDEENLISALIAKQNGAKRVVSKISRINYMKVINKLGIDNVICPKIITTNQILKYVRGNTIESLYKIVEGQAEIIEFIVKKDSRILNIPLKKLNLPQDILIATIVRRNEIIIPKGNDSILKGDRVIIIAKNSKINDIDELIDMGENRNEFQNGIKKLGSFINR